MIGPPTRLSQNSPSIRPASSFTGTDGRFSAEAMQSSHATQSAQAVAPGATPRPGGGNGAASSRLDGRREVTPSGDVCRLLSLLADRTRLKILRILAGGERPVVALTGELRLPQPTVSHHLAWLRMMDLVSPRRQGKHVYYALGPAAQCDDAGVLTLTADDATVTITPYTGG